MQTLHLRAENDVLEKLIAVVNQFSMRGDKIEILDNHIYSKEKQMIQKAIAQDKNGDVVAHDELWDELLA